MSFADDFTLNPDAACLNDTDWPTLQAARRAGQDMHAEFGFYSDTKVITVSRRQLFWRAFAIGSLAGILATALAFAGWAAVSGRRAAEAAQGANVGVEKARERQRCIVCGRYVRWGQDCSWCASKRGE